jgi:hypothetical protein
MKKIILFGFIIGSIVSISYAKDLKKGKTDVKNVSVSSKTVVSSTNTNNKNMVSNNNISNKSLENSNDYSEEKGEGVVVDENFEYKTEERTEDLFEDGKTENIKGGSILPYSFGVFRGVLNIDGKPVLVFETDETIYFITIYKENEKIKWKLYGKLSRG